MKPLLIDGQWVETGHAVENINPSDLTDVIDRYAQAGAAEAQTAIGAAAEAAPEWADTGLLARHDILKRAGAEILERKQELGRLLSREEGKTLREGIGEAERAGRIFEFFAGEVVRQSGAHLDSVRPGIEIDVTRAPIGPVGLITPWNFPLAIPAWKMAPALAFGNTVVFKPAELVPGSAWALTEILHRAGVPPGVLNLVMGQGRVVGQAMLEDPKLKAISFTGSTATGARVAQASV
ncbi:MAG: aldehyde dehydrogenase family protein, partial [Pseudomonadota bacterium]